MNKGLERHVPALAKVENTGRFYQAVEAITDALDAQYPTFLNRLLEAPGETFIPSLRFYALTGTAKIVGRQK